MFGGGPLGHLLFFGLQAGTMLILVLAANTSFADFPRLASFHAGDAFMPKQLTKRGHRLVFSNGILALAATSIVLILITGAKVDHLIPLYAVGVFTSFTMSQAGMARHHVRKKEPGWRKGLFVNATGAVLSAVVDVVIIVTKFKPPGQPLGAWVILVIVPVMVFALTRLNKQYESESSELAADVRVAAEAPVFHRHTVLLLIDDLDRSAAKGIQYARSLSPDEMRAVHVAVDLDKAERLMNDWLRLGLTRFSLEIVDCPDRRIVHSVLEVVAEALADGRTEVTVLVPRREYRRFWHRFLHDRTSEAIAKALARVRARERHVRAVPTRRRAARRGPVDGEQPCRMTRSRSVTCSTAVEPMSGAASGPCGFGRGATTRHSSALLVDETGGITLVFLARRQLAGIRPGTMLRAEGMVGAHQRRLAILNPVYELEATA